MNSLDIDFHRRLAKRLDEATAEDTNHLISGMLDHTDYKRVCGRIKAYADIREWCADIESLINQGK